MSRQRKYLDRGRWIALERRPIAVDWATLLGAGRNTVQKGRADAAPFLSEVMCEGVDRAVFAPAPRPAALDHPLLRRWLDVNEQEAITYLCDGWGYALNQPAPETAAEARALLNRPYCAPKEQWRHFMYTVKFILQDGPLEWYVGYCSGCLRALLMLDDDTNNTVRWWQFYDQETT